MNSGLVFYQLFEAESSTYTYLLGDEKSGEAVLIDPVREMVERDLKLVTEIGLKLAFVLETHIHADHVTGAAEIRKRTRAKTVVGRHANASCSDRTIEQGEVLQFGAQTLKAIETPGHTDGCMSYV